MCYAYAYLIVMGLCGKGVCHENQVVVAVHEEIHNKLGSTHPLAGSWHCFTILPCCFTLAGCKVHLGLCVCVCVCVCVYVSLVPA